MIFEDGSRNRWKVTLVVFLCIVFQERKHKKRLRQAYINRLASLPF